MTRPALARRWRRVRQLSARTPLRVRIMSAVLALVVVALIAISVAGISFLRGYLLAGYDASYLQPYQSSYDPNAQAWQILRDPQQTSVQACAARAETSAGPCLVPSQALYWIPQGGKLLQIAAPTTASRLGPTDQQTLPSPDVQAALPWLTANLGQPTTVPALTGRSHWRVVAYRDALVSANGQTMINGTLIVSVDVSSVYFTIGRLVSIDLVVSGIIVVALAIVGIAIVRTSLRPLTDIERTAEAIAAGDLSRRVPDSDPRTEVGRLGRSLNTMLGHIEAAFHARSASEASARRSEERLRRFVADASHELRTPLTAIRGYAEYYRQRGGLAGDATLTSADMERIMQRVEQESARMGALVEDMLLLARMDQQRPLQLRPVDLLTLAVDAVQDARIVAPVRKIELTVSPGAAFLVQGDEPRLRQVLGNLMTNALTHTPDGTTVEMRVAATAVSPQSGDPLPVPHILVEVADHGPGLTAEQAEHVFERFYRADQSRGRHTGGTGLGLAIVASLVAAHGGEVGVRSRPGEGATFWITLPLSPDAQAAPDDDPA